MIDTEGNVIESIEVRCDRLIDRVFGAPGANRKYSYSGCLDIRPIVVVVVAPEPVVEATAAGSAFDGEDCSGCALHLRSLNT